MGRTVGLTKSLIEQRKAAAAEAAKKEVDAKKAAGADKAQKK